MKECCIVTRSSYDGNHSSYVSLDMESAVNSIEEEIDATVRSLAERGYNPIVNKSDGKSYCVFVAFSGIYYDWSVRMAEIR